MQTTTFVDAWSLDKPSLKIARHSLGILRLDVNYFKATFIKDLTAAIRT